jgi:hypothetical protein
MWFALFLGAMALGLASLVSNNFLSPDAQVRRKAHVMLWGTVVGVVPILEIPVLLKRSARYLLVQRGFTILLLVLWLAAIRLFTLAISGMMGTFSNTVIGLALAFGVGLVWISAPLVKRTTERIDSAFFRSAYDARQILENLVEEARTVASREELAVLLGGEIRQALHPGFAAVYMADRDGKLRVYPETGLAKQTLPSRVPLLEELAQRNELWQISDIDPRERGLLNDLAIFAPNPPECLVPIRRVAER